MTETEPKARAIFFDALDFDSTQCQQEFLREVCGDDRTLRQRVDELLRSHREAEEFLEGAPSNAAAFPQHASGCCPQSVGPYKLREQIGEGGMGVVYVAEQTEPVTRKVALKIIKPGMATKDVVARFDAERQALAMMDHSNIARVFDGGTTESGQPYFVMELVQGPPITEYCDRHRLTNVERLKLFSTVCDAVQHAHRRGVIHRDLKPTNLLVPTIDGAAVPKVIDFGIAKAIDQKLTSHTIYTQFSQMVGTPLYMSPEQAELGVVDVDTRSDVYSLGVLLYELLTGKTPFDNETLKHAGHDEVRRIIREDEPPRPSARVSTLRAETLSTVSEQRASDSRHLAETLKGELDWIVMKALEKDRSRRYDSPSALSEDVQRFLANDPITARPPSAMYRFKKFAQRNSARLIPASIVSAVLMVGVAFALTAAVNARQAKDTLAFETARGLYASQLRDGFIALQSRDYGAVDEYLAKSTPGEGSPDFRGWESYYLQRQSRRPFAESPRGKVIQAAWRPRHNHIAVCVARPGHQTIELWKPGSRTPLVEPIDLPGAWPNVMCWSNDGSRLALGHWNGRAIVLDITTGETVFDRYLHQRMEDSGGMKAIDLSPSGTTLVSASFVGQINVWDVNQNKETRELQVPDDDQAVQVSGSKNVSCVAFSPNGHELVVRLRFGRVLRWDLRDDSPDPTESKYERTGNGGGVVEWHPSGKYFVSTDHLQVAVYRTETKAPVATFPHVDVRSVCWVDNDDVFATGGADQAIRIWDLARRSEIQSLRVDRGPIEVCGASTDGRYLALRSGVSDRLQFINLDQLHKPLGYQVLSPRTRRDDRGWNVVRWSHDGRYIAAGQNDGRRYVGMYGATVRVFDPNEGSCIVEYSTGTNTKIEWSRDDKSVEVVDSEGRFHTLSAAEPFVKNVRVLPEESDYFRFKTFNTFSDSAVNRRRGLIALPWWKTKAGDLNQVCIFDFQAIVSLDTISSHPAEIHWSPDSRLLGIVEKYEPNVLIYDAEKRRQHSNDSLKGKVRWNSTATSVAWNPASTELTVGTFDGAIHIIDAETLTIRSSLEGHRAPVDSLAWSPGGSRVASFARDDTLRIWDSVAGHQVAAFHLADGVHISSLDWSPDGRTLAAGVSGTGEIFVFDAGQSMPSEEAPERTRRTAPIHGRILIPSTDVKKREPIDDFDDGNDDGWTRLDSIDGKSWGPASHSAKSGVYHLTSAGNVQHGSPTVSYLAALWDKSSDPIYSDGLVRSKVRVDSDGCCAAIAFRISMDDQSRANGYLFVAGGPWKTRNFGLIRIREGRTTFATSLGRPDLKFGVGQEWWIEVGGFEHQLSMKVWRAGEAEPEAPQLTIMDSTYSEGFLGVETNFLGYAPNPARIDATFDDISFTPRERVPDPLEK